MYVSLYVSMYVLYGGGYTQYVDLRMCVPKHVCTYVYMCVM